MSLRVSFSRSSAMVATASLSEPAELIATVPPFRSAAVFTAGTVKKPKRMMLASDAMVRSSAPFWLSCTTEESPTCITSSLPARTSAAPRLPPPMLLSVTLRLCLA